MDLKSKIRSIKDFPKEGIIFRDITTLLSDAEGLCEAIDQMSNVFDGLEYDFVVGPESRGFIFGVPVAYKLKKGFIPVRKKGKLPAAVVSKVYDLEYGSSTIEIHADAIKPGQKVVIVDDLLATGGTAAAMIELIEEMGGIVEGICFLIELEGLGGREALGNRNIKSLMTYKEL